MFECVVGIGAGASLAKHGFVVQRQTFHTPNHVCTTEVAPRLDKRPLVLSRPVAYLQNYRVVYHINSLCSVSRLLPITMWKDTTQQCPSEDKYSHNIFLISQPYCTTIYTINNTANHISVLII